MSHAASTSDAAHGDAGLSVLYVEDNAANVLLMRQVFRLFGEVSLSVAGWAQGFYLERPQPLVDALSRETFGGAAAVIAADVS